MSVFASSYLCVYPESQSSFRYVVSFREIKLFIAVQRKEASSKSVIESQMQLDLIIEIK